jgi:signal transduction histidine kinase
VQAKSGEAGIPRGGPLRTLDAARPMTDNSDMQETSVRASRRRLLLRGDTERRKLERDLHDGLQQDLVALSVNLQLAGRLVEHDVAATKALLEDMRRDVHQSLENAALLAGRIYPQLEELGLAVTLRSAAASAGVRGSVEVDPAIDVRDAQQIMTTVYWCWLDVLQQCDRAAEVELTVRSGDGALLFDVIDGAAPTAALECVRDRIETFDGTVTVVTEPDGRTRLSALLPLPR